MTCYSWGPAPLAIRGLGAHGNLVASSGVAAALSKEDQELNDSPEVIRQIVALVGAAEPTRLQLAIRQHVGARFSRRKQGFEPPRERQ